MEVTTSTSGIIVSALIILLFCPANSAAQDESGPLQRDTYKVQYYDVSQADNTIHVINPQSVSRCAQFYVFDNNQLMQECCACLVGPNGFVTLSVENDLIRNPSHGSISPTKGVIDLMVTAPNNGPNCAVVQNHAPAEANIVPTLRAWIKHRTLEDNDQEVFEDVRLVEGQEDALETSCANTIFGGLGVCTCGSSQ